MKSERINIYKKKDIAHQIFQLKITLRDISPPIWRRVLVSSYLTFFQLHEIIQEYFYWEDYHLHEFSFSFPGQPHWKIRLRPNIPEEDDEIFDYEYDAREDEIRLCDVLSQKVKRVKYCYDFGDRWDHEIRLEKIYPNSSYQFHSFLCVGGKRAAPPEDSGGSYGYQKMLDALNDPSHHRHKEMKDWVDDNFDPEKMQCPMNKMTSKEIEQKFGPSIIP